MANLRNLNIGIGTNLGALDKGLSQAQKKITSFSEGVESRLGSISTGRLERELSNISAKGVPAANKLASSMGNLQSPVRSSTSAVINFNRVIQDAPFGILGVANNLNPLVNSFNQLKQQTGSATGALTTLLKSAFTGPGALITVISVASSAMLFFSQRMRGAGDSAKEANSELSDFKETLEEVAKTEVGGIFEDLTNEQKLSALEDALAQFEPTEELTKSINTNWDEIVAGANKAAKNAAQLNSETANVQANIDQLTGQSTVFTEEQLEQLKQEHEINDAVEEELKNRLAQARATNLIREQLEKIGIQQDKNNKLSMRQLRLRNDLAEAREELQPDDSIIEEDIAIPDVEVDLGEKIFPPGSLGALQQRLKSLQTSFKSAMPGTTEFEELKSQLDLTEEQINELKNSTEEAGKSGSVAMKTVGDAVGGVVGQLIRGRKEALSFSGIMSSILPALANVLFPGSGFLAGAARGLFGGIFHQGGVVPGPVGQERLALVQGGETIRTPQQERAIGSNVRVDNRIFVDGRELEIALEQQRYSRTR